MNSNSGFYNNGEIYTNNKPESLNINVWYRNLNTSIGNSSLYDTQGYIPVINKNNVITNPYVQSEEQQYAGTGFGNVPCDENLKLFTELLFELSKYNPDLKAILENSELSVNQNQNEGVTSNPYAVNIDTEVNPNPFLSNIKGSGNNVNLNKNEKNNTEDKNNTSENNVNISESNPIVADITADSICNLLTSQYAIIVDVSKLPKSPKQIVNELTSNNDLDNQTVINVSSNKSLVALSADLFNDLIYYFIIDAVAKENCMTFTDNCDHSKALTDVKQKITESLQKLSQQIDNYTQIESINKCAPDDINQTVSNLKNNVENGELQKIIKDNLENKNESSGFWVQFLCSVLKRASFVYSLCQFFACTQKLKCFDTLKQADIDKRKFMDKQKLESDRKNHLIDTFLSILQILLLLSLIFGFGAIANVILGLIVLATFVYKFINQYPKQKQKFLVYKLLQSNYFGALAKRNGLALIPEVAKIYQYGEQTKTDIQNIGNQKLNIISKNTTGYIQNQPEQYPSYGQINQSQNFS